MLCNEEKLGKWLSEAKTPVWLAGAGTMGASAELWTLAGLHPKLRFAATPRAKGVFPECASPSYLGVSGFCGDGAADAFIEKEADLLVVSGTRLGETSGGSWKYKRLGIPVVRIDAQRGKLRRHPSTALEIEREIREVLGTLIQLGRLEKESENAAKNTTEEWLNEERVTANWVSVNEELEEKVREIKGTLTRIHPLEATLALQRAVSAEVPIYCDIGNTMCWLIRYLKRLLPRTWHVNLVLGSMGYAIPAAAGGAVALGRPVVATVGDAAFLMSCGELATLARLGLPVVVVCFSNGTHGTVDLGCKKLFPGSPIPSMLLEPKLDIVGVAKAMGVEGQRFDSVLGLEDCLSAALARGKPYVIDVAIDPEIEAPIAQRVDALVQQLSGVSDTPGEKRS